MKCGLRLILGCSCFGIILLTGIILFALSFNVIELEEWGLKYNTTWQTIEKEPYSSGRYFTGLGKEFIKYPRKLLTITFNSDTDAQAFSLSAWTKEGLNVYIDVSMFFRLNEYKLYDLYQLLGDTWYAYLVRIVYSAVKETTTQFETQSFFNSREKIDQAIQDKVKEYFEQVAKQAIILEDLQLREIKFESIIEEKISLKLIQSQEKKTAYQRNETLSIKKQTEREKMEAENTINLINREAAEKANAEYFKILFQAIIDSYVELFKELEITDSKERLQFIYVSELPQMNPQIKSFVGFKQPLIGG